MMISKSILCAGLLLSLALNAQDNQKLYRVKNGTDLSKSIPVAERYQFREFRNGKVYFRNGKTSPGKLNYSIVHSEVQFISPTNDTLLLADNDFVDRVSIADDIYYYFHGHGHIQRITDTGKMWLGKKVFLEVAGEEKYSAYEQYTSSSAITTFSSYMGKDGKMMPLSGNSLVLIRKRIAYFWVDQNQRVYQASRANLLKICRRDKLVVNRFIDENKINFETEESLLSVLKFTSTL
jgi:hypothetical protein